MKLKIWIASKSVYIPAEFAQYFMDRLNEVCKNADATEKDGDKFVPYKKLTLELRAD